MKAKNSCGVRRGTKKAASGGRRTRQMFEPTTASESGAVDEGFVAASAR
jgi:hypothetical protein